ncbi:MAG: MaoC family dehydratase [Myxococcales bacterium]|nr:MaoC family dehydratase [Myxococcales bacterium]
MSKTNPGHYFEDFEVGAELLHAVPRTISEGDQALYIGLTGDRNPLHSSAELARSLGYAREPIHDMLAFHIVFGKTVNDVSLNAVANLGYSAVRFVRPVYPGDTLRSRSTVLGKKENRSGKNGIVWVHTVGTNQREEIVIEYRRWVMVHKRDHGTPTGADDRPEMPPEVLADALRAPEGVSYGEYPTWVTGNPALWEDYAVGETIHHIDGMTVEESEHATATRLYQNTAKVHFDACYTKGTRFGRRLMYGGHVISLARALSFNGLENALSILAWNAGSHANPMFAGDTLYASSEILEKAPLRGRDDCGALRVRLVATKDQNPADVEIPLKIERDGKSVYHSAILLDLDYWLLMPRR